MPRAICEDCGSLVEAELTYNGICAVGHYVHCGWGHELSPDDLISDDGAKIIADLEAKLSKTEGLLAMAMHVIKGRIHWEASGLTCDCGECQALVATVAQIEGESHE